MLQLQVCERVIILNPDKLAHVVKPEKQRGELILHFWYFPIQTTTKKHIPFDSYVFLVPTHL